MEHYEQVPEEEGGAVDAQAGSHPFQLTTTLAVNQSSNPIVPPALAKDLQFSLPPGLVANATALPQCSEEDFRKITAEQNHCPGDTAIGVATITFDEPKLGLRTYPLPIFNLVPSHGEPVRFGFTVVKTPVTIDSAVRTGSDYGATVSVANIPEVINFLSESVTFWGVPASPAHDEARGWACLAAGVFNVVTTETCQHTHPASSKPFLTLPSSCAAPFASTVEGRSWPPETAPGVFGPGVALPAFGYSLKDPSGAPVGLTGCNQEPFAPSIEAAPDVQEASKPSGLTVHVRVPQEVGENSLGLGSSDVRGITVELPQGMTLNPAGAGGLQGCSNGQIGYEGPKLFPSVPETELLTFTPTLPEPLSPGLELAAKGFCPDGSKIGTVEDQDAVAREPARRSVYLASQNANPFGSLVAMYIVARRPGVGDAREAPGRCGCVKRRAGLTARRALGRGRSSRRSRTRRSCRLKMPNCISSVGNARRWRPPRVAAPTPPTRRSRRGLATRRRRRPRPSRSPRARTAARARGDAAVQPGVDGWHARTSTRARSAR